jgi:hypothetical protein
MSRKRKTDSEARKAPKPMTQAAIKEAIKRAHTRIVGDTGYHGKRFS